MGYIEIRNFNTYKTGKANHCEYWFEPSKIELDIILTHLKQSSSPWREDRSCYIFGYGKQPKSTYIDLSKQGVNVVWRGVKGPFWVKAFSFIIATFYGLIKLSKPQNIQPVIEKLSHLSMVGFFSFDQSNEEKFINFVTSSGLENDPENFIKQDSTHFAFILDGDNLETKSGLLGILFIGQNCPQDLKEIVKNFGEIGYIGKKSF